MGESGIVEYPQTAVVRKRHRGWKIAGIAVAAAVVIAGGVWGGTSYASYSAAQAATAAQIAKQAAVAPAPIGATNTVDEQTAMASSDQAGGTLIVSTEKQLAAQAAAAKAAAVKAAAAKAAATRVQTVASPGDSGPIKCPAGSTANSNDGVNDTSCFPDICFHIVVPDPAHPECNTAFKP